MMAHQSQCPSTHGEVRQTLSSNTLHRNTHVCTQSNTQSVKILLPSNPLSSKKYNNTFEGFIIEIYLTYNVSLGYIENYTYVMNILKVIYT